MKSLMHESNEISIQLFLVEAACRNTVYSPGYFAVSDYYYRGLQGIDYSYR